MIDKDNNLAAEALFSLCAGNSLSGSDRRLCCEFAGCENSPVFTLEVASAPNNQTTQQPQRTESDGGHVPPCNRLFIAFPENVPVLAGCHLDKEQSN